MTAVHFYTSCTQTKSAAASPSLSAKSLLASSVSDRFDAWCECVDGWEGDRWTALNLYCGGHWSVMRSLVSGSQIDLPPLRSYAISAGYGVISTASRIAPYAATFSVGHEDSISRARGKNAPAENAEWWHELTSWRPKGVRGPRSIQGIFKSAPDSVHLFALSPSYLDAISDDLTAGREELSDPEKLIIISNGKKRHGSLISSVVTAPAALQSVVGGALASLNVRIAAKILQVVPDSRMTTREVRTFIADLLRRASPRDIPQRCDRSDSQVAHYIRRALSCDSASSYTRMLKMFRDAGNACEMKRFKKLYQDAVDHANND